jgi:hypothetical protein
MPLCSLDSRRGGRWPQTTTRPFGLSPALGGGRSDSIRIPCPKRGPRRSDRRVLGTPRARPDRLSDSSPLWFIHARFQPAKIDLGTEALQHHLYAIGAMIPRAPADREMRVLPPPEEPRTEDLNTISRAG